MIEQQNRGVMDMIELKPGMRMRCMKDYGSLLRKDREYTVKTTVGDYVSFDGERYFPRRRFKPVITEGPFRGMTHDDALDLVRGGY